ncbi:MAG: type II toxin-antitoxin system RelE/ParE family toxin [Cyanobacteria bacterium P01_D01_bin.56]
MAKRILFRPKASQDIDEHYKFIDGNNPDAALAFFDAVRETVAQIARMPGIGSLYPVNQPSLQGIRKWAVKRYKKYLIFYFEREDAVEIVRILYASQDISSIFDQPMDA